jgi:hypothetical protein
MSAGQKARLAAGGLVMFYCPGCKNYHGVNTDQTSPNPLTGAKWQWNGSLDSPTFTPSILVRGTVPITDAEADRIMAGEAFEPTPRVCHSFVTAGRIQFLGDCTHELAGQTVDIPDED